MGTTFSGNGLGCKRVGRNEILAITGLDWTYGGLVHSQVDRLRASVY